MPNFARSVFFAGLPSRAVICMAIALVGQSSTLYADPGPGAIQVAPVGLPKVLSPGLYGFNLDFWFATHAARLDNPTLLRAAAALHPMVLRYPGGTLANYWDWRTGWFVGHDLPNHLRWTKHRTHVPYTLSRFKAIVDATGAFPVFDLNLLTSKLSDQLSMLYQAQNLGLPVRYVELGNEFYLSKTGYKARFPTPQSYALRARRWATAIHHLFPKAHVAAVGFWHVPGQRPAPRAAQWNANIGPLAEVQAVTMHDYAPPARFIPRAMLQGHLDASAIPLLLGLPFQAVRGLDESRDGLPVSLAHLPIWVTEYNLGPLRLGGHPYPDAIDALWVHGLYNATLGLLLGQNPHVRMVLVHALIGSPMFSVLQIRSPYRRSASGYTLSLLYRSAKEATSLQILGFTPEPMAYPIPLLRSGRMPPYPTLLGAVFQGPRSQRAVLINLSSQPRTLDMGKLLGGPFHYRERYAPAQMTIAGNQTPTTLSGNATTSFVLKPYAIALLRKVIILSPGRRAHQ